MGTEEIGKRIFPVAGALKRAISVAVLLKSAIVLDTAKLWFHGAQSASLRFYVNLLLLGVYVTEERLSKNF